MPTLPDAVRRRPASGAPLKEDLRALYLLADEAVSRVAHVGEVLKAVVAAIETLKSGDTAATSGLTTLQGLATDLRHGMTALQSSVQDADECARAQSQSQSEILASVVETLLEVYDSVQTVQVALVGLKATVQEQGSCPWKELSAEALFQAIEVLGDLAPRIKLVVEDRLVATGHDPDTGKKQWWGRVFADRAREAVVHAFFALLAGGILGLFAWVQFLGGRSGATQGQTELHRLLTQKVEALEAQAAKDAAELAKLRAQERPARRPPTRP